MAKPLLTDALWKRIESLLPPHKPRRRRFPGRKPIDDRKALMFGHGAVGRTFAGRIVQVITGSTGVDDWEWGVTLFGRRPDDLKE